MKPDALLGYADKPKVWMDISVGDELIGRITIELDWKLTPFTAENFRAIAAGVSPVKDQHYKGSRFHRLIAGFMIQGGDYEKNDGTGGESVYGRRMNDENLSKPFTHRGQVAMANNGKDDNGSQFFITFDSCPHLTGKNVVFGQLIDRESFRVLDVMEDQETQKFTNYRPAKAIIISDCGTIPAVVSTK